MLGPCNPELQVRLVSGQVRPGYTLLLVPWDALWARCTAVVCHLRGCLGDKAFRAEWHSETRKGF